MENPNDRNIRTTSLVIILLISALFIASPPAGMRLQASPNPDTPQAAPNKVAEFNLPNIEGGQMSNEDLKGKVAVVDVWATWCGPCLSEISIYNRLYDTVDRDDVAIVGVVIESPRRDIASKVRQVGINYPVLIGDEEAIKTFGVQGTPTTLVLNKDGTIYKRYKGAVPDKEEKIRQDIENLLGQDSTESASTPPVGLLAHPH